TWVAPGVGLAYTTAVILACELGVLKGEYTRALVAVLLLAGVSAHGGPTPLPSCCYGRCR
ncbi:MAG: hypothetical protein AAGA59_21920, partial [Actinomycetota bacterium]